MESEETVDYHLEHWRCLLTATRSLIGSCYLMVYNLGSMDLLSRSD